MVSARGFSGVSDHTSPPFGTYLTAALGRSFASVLPQTRQLRISSTIVVPGCS
jgi:hypothetical protein